MVIYFGVIFCYLVLLVYLLGIVSMVFMVLWMKCFWGGYGFFGFGVFNFYFLIMFVGFIFLLSEVIVMYKIFSGDKKFQKRVYMIVQGVVIFFVVLGVIFVYKFYFDIGI